MKKSKNLYTLMLFLILTKNAGSYLSTGYSHFKKEKQNIGGKIMRKNIIEILSCLVVVGILMSVMPAVVAEGAPDRSNEIPPEFQNRTSSSETIPMVSNSNSLSVNSSDVKASSTPKMDKTLADMIDALAPGYYNNSWNLSLSQYKAWIALITLSEAPTSNWGYAAQSTASPGNDVFDHVDLKSQFRFSTGIGPFQLDNGGEGGGENWTNMTTIDKTDPDKSLRSVLRWHNVSFGSKWKGAKAPTLYDFYNNTKWFGVKRVNITEYWYSITNSSWDEVKNKKIEVEYHPPNGSYPYENYVKKIGKVYWNLWEGCYDTWLIKGIGPGYKGEFYYTYNNSVEVWVFNDTDKKYIYRFARKYVDTQLPQDSSGKTITKGTLYAGITDKKAALNLTKPCYSLDLIFTIDTTGSMWDDIDEVKASASAIVDAIAANISGYRIAVVDYKDFPVSPYGDPGDYPFHDVLPFSTIKSTIIAAIQGLIVGGGADWEESVYSALMHSINSTSLGGWRGSDQAAKVIILMGDAPPHDPEPFTGYTLSSVVTAAENADPVIIYPVQIGGTVEKFEELANQTGGKAFTAENAGEVVDAILDAIEEIKTKPIAHANGPYLGYVGCPITFDGTGSYDLDGTIVSYEWDFDDDGEFDDATGATPSKTWNSVYFGNISLKVTDNDGNEDVDSTTVTVREPVAIETATGTGTAYFASDAGTIEDLIALNESDLPEETPNVDFPHGLFSFNITGLTPGQNVTLIITFPSDIPTTGQYWKYGPNGSINNPQPERWYQITMGSNDGDNIITIQLTDGGIGDDDGVANGVIVDQGGPGIPTAVARVPTLTPIGIIALVGLLSAVAISKIRRREN